MIKVGVATSLVAFGLIAPGHRIKRLGLMATGMLVLLWPLG